jgi:glutamate synthase (NADPH/NADH) large chain
MRASDLGYDSCALMAHLSAHPTRQGIERVLEGLECMEHRTGIVTGESDGVGVMVDVPCDLWAEHVGDLAYAPNFWVAHLFLPPSQATAALERVAAILQADGWQIVAQRWREVCSEVLGACARREEPVFVQIAGLMPADEPSPERALFQRHLRIERETAAHVVSLSRWSVVYKVQGGARTLRAYYPDLQSLKLTSAITIGHSRYSTNTMPAFARVQPFSVLAHNGEINTIDRLRREARMLGVRLSVGGSDSQDTDRLLHHLLVEYGLSLAEALEVLFPPVWSQVERMPEPKRLVYRHIRAFLGPVAQGPAAIIARWGDTCAFATDALGLRPLWCVPTEEGLYVCSERASLPMEIFTDDPVPLAPGEKVIAQVVRGQTVEWSPATKDPLLQVPPASRGNRTGARLGSPREAAATDPALGSPREAAATDPALGSPREAGGTLRRGAITNFEGAVGVSRGNQAGTPCAATLAKRGEPEGGGQANAAPAIPLRTRLAWHNFCTDDLDYLEHLAQHGAEPIGSLGYDGPLAVLHPEGQSLSDYCKESVAVVTNPALDRDRETEHFNTQTLLGARPATPYPIQDAPQGYRELPHPFLLSQRLLSHIVPPEAIEQACETLGALTLESLPTLFRTQTLSIAQSVAESLAECLQRLAQTAVQAVQAGAEVLVLDDTLAFEEGWLPVDPHLALASVDRALRETDGANGHALRRNCSLVLVSGGLRNLHDLIFAFSLGADAFCAYLLLEAGVMFDAERAEIAPEERVARLRRLITGLCKGLEKVISTMGTHELRGYGRNFAGIGVAPSIAATLEIPTFCASESVGLTLAQLEREARRRYELARSNSPVRERRDPRFFPKIWKIAGQVAEGLAPFSAYSDKVAQTEQELPVALRNLLCLRLPDRAPLPPEAVDTSVGHHRYPFHISAMSFGSQGEVAFRAYAEAARRLEILCINGEGGEIRDMLGRYTPYRGQQVASGRFGVSPEMLNAACVIEIKIGQGAKPGEGGHLPGKKVTPKIAAARNATPGCDLISPSNNHDLYSIEDLAQLIEELKTCNPHAKISVKVPVVPNIGTIAVGIAKAGADIINLSGFEGGTGAARTHALKFAGLPVEIGVKEAHRALCAAGLRSQVELWADGGLKTGRDVVKMLLLGANRCGFGTLAMVAAGCTICRACQTDTCHVGIATQIETVEEAMRKGLKRFVPRDYESAVDQLCRFFEGLGDEVRQLTAALGFRRTQDLVGRCDLLEQAFGHEWVDLTELLEPVALSPIDYAVTRPRGALQEALVLAPSVSETHADALCVRCERGSRERALGTATAGALVRQSLADAAEPSPQPPLALTLLDSIAGNGLGAFNAQPLHLRVYGGAQDGVGKCALGGRIVVLKGRNRVGKWLDGGVGKSFAYGAQRGLFIVQGVADSRFAIRLSGASVVAGARLTHPICDAEGVRPEHAHLKGFAFEYMTAGIAVVMGDPGPWLCAGMTGGVVYVKLWHEYGFDLAALQRRLAPCAKVALTPIDAHDAATIRELLDEYRCELLKSGQADEAEQVAHIAATVERDFVAIRPVTQQTAQHISTE